MTQPAIDALLALYIPGPEELYAQLSEMDASAAAQRHNDAIRSQVGEHFHPDAHAKAVIWPLDPASHAECLATGEAAIMSSNHLGVPDSLASAVMDAAAMAYTPEIPALFDVDARALPALALFTYAEDATLSRIMVMPHPDGDGVLLVATDRKCMAVWHDPQGKTNGKLMIPMPDSASLDLIVKAGVGIHEQPRMTYKCDHYQINLGAYGEICDKGTPPMEDNIFPDPLRVIPKETALANGLQGRITLEHIRKFAKAAKRARKTFSIYPRHDELTFWSKGERGHGVIVARCQAAPNLLMFTTPVASEVDGQRKPYVGGFNTIFPE